LQLESAGKFFMNSPLPYRGGKNRIADEIVSILPDGKVYVEVFGGSAALLLHKPESQMEVYNDLHSGVSNFFDVITGKKNMQEVVKQLSILPYSRILWEKYSREWKMETDRIRKAVKWYYTQRCSFSGSGRSWGSCKSAVSSRWEASYAVLKYLRSIEMLPELHRRMRTVQVENLDREKVLDKYDSEETVFYMDPPYHPDVRVKKQMYEHEMNEEAHIQMLMHIMSLKGSILLSGYDHEDYRVLDRTGFRRKVINTIASLKKGENLPRQEVVWYRVNKHQNQQLQLFSNQSDPGVKIDHA